MTTGATASTPVVPGASSAPVARSPIAGSTGKRCRPEAVPILGCDGFLLALDAMMRRAGQGPHISYSVMLLDRPPRRELIEQAWRGLIRAHPIAIARLGRSWRSGIPVWRVPSQVRDSDIPEVGFWQEAGAADAFEASRQVDSLTSLLRDVLDPGNGRRRPDHWVELHVVARCDRSAALVVRWSHVILDGKGVELLLTDLAKRCCGEGPDSANPVTPPSKPTVTWKKRRERMRHFVEHHQRVMRGRFSSLGGSRPKEGACHCRVVKLNEAESRAVVDRAAAMSSQLITTPFYFAAAARAHHRVFQSRGRGDVSQLVSLPVQIRPKAVGGPIFQNHVSILFFRLNPEDLETMESATASVVKQFQEMMRHRLDLSFAAMQDMMRWVPPGLYMRMLRSQMHGEISSFFHSHTGAFAPDVTQLDGARVIDAFHLPRLSSPPGTGLFLNEFGSSLRIQMSWRSTALRGDEPDLLLDSFVHDLVDGVPTSLEQTLEI